MFMAVVLLVCGLLLLLAGGEVLVRGASSLAARIKMPPLIIGIVVIGFGTSTPELLVSIQAALSGASDIAVGNVVGSNIANILLILGLAALISPFVVVFSNYQRDLAAMVFASLVLLGVGYLGIVSRPIALALLVLLASYLYYIVRSAQKNGEVEATDTQPMRHWLFEALALVGGLAALIFGAQILVENASFIARFYNVSEAAIGLTVVAVGTSLPELAASVMAALKRQTELAVGNILGSNIFNILGILGVTSLVDPVSISPAIAGFDIPFMVGVALLLALCFYWLKGVGRFAAIGFLASYALYVWLQF